MHQIQTERPGQAIHAVLLLRTLDRADRLYGLVIANPGQLEFGVDRRQERAGSTHAAALVLAGVMNHANSAIERILQRRHDADELHHFG